MVVGCFVCQSLDDEYQEAVVRCMQAALLRQGTLGKHTEHVLLAIRGEGELPLVAVGPETHNEEMLKKVKRRPTTCGS